MRKQLSIFEDGHFQVCPGKWSEYTIVFLLHGLLACVGTYPAIRSISSAFIGYGDSVQNAWNLWWVQQSISQGNLFPFYTRMLYYPVGVSLAYHPLGALNGWFSFLLHKGLGFNLATVYNVITLLTFILSGAGTYLLVRQLTGSRTAAFCASLIFTFAPIRMSRIHYSGLEMYSTQFIPFSAYCVVRMAQTRKLRYAFLSALFLAATTWISLYLALGTGLFLIVLISFDLLSSWQSRERWMKLIKNVFFLGFSTLILTTPVLLAMINSYRDFKDQSNQLVASSYTSADLLSFFVPDFVTSPLITRLSPAVKNTAEKVFYTTHGELTEKTVFIGYTVLILFLITLLILRTKSLWPWIGALIFFFIYCLGPELWVGGHLIVRHMPYELITHLPLIGFGNAPSRYSIFLMLALAVISGYGLAALEDRRKQWRVFSVLVSVIIFLEFLIIPIRLDSRFTSIPPYYPALASKPGGDYGVIDVPIDLMGAAGPAGNYMLYQTAHGKSILSGYLARTPTKVMWPFERPFLNQLRARIYGDTDPYQFDSATLSGAVEDLCSVRAGYIILHRDELAPQDFDLIKSAFVSVLMTQPDYEDDRLSVWETGELLANCQ